jgi:MFS family permease
VHGVGDRRAIGVTSSSAGTEESSAKWGVKPVFFLAVMFMGYAVYAVDRTVLSSLLNPLSSALGLTPTETGLLVSAQYIGVFSFVGLAGHLSDRYGRWRIILTGVMMFSLFTGLIGLSQNFLQAFVFRLVSGFGEGIFWPVAMAAVSGYFGRSKGLALGIFYVGFDVGSVLGLNIGGGIFALTSDWRTGFFVAPLLGLPVIAGVFAGRRTVTESEAGGVRVNLGRDAAYLLGKRSVLLLCLFALLATWASVWQVAFLPFYYAKVLGLGTTQAAFLASLVLASGGFGKVVLGRASDLLRRKWLLLVMSMLLVIMYGVFFSTGEFYAAMAAALSMGFFSGAVFPILQGMVADSSEEMVGTGLGLSTTFQSVAAVFSLSIAGTLSDPHGIAGVLLGISSIGLKGAITLTALIPAVLMCVICLFLVEPGRTGN